MNIFEYASRNKLRFTASNGIVSTEDLWGMTEANLKVIGRALQAEVNSTDVLFSDETVASKKLTVKLEIIKYVLESKKADAEAKEQAKANAARRALIANALESRDLAELANMSKAELQAELVKAGGSV